MEIQQELATTRNNDDKGKEDARVRKPSFFGVEFIGSDWSEDGFSTTPSKFAGISDEDEFSPFKDTSYHDDPIPSEQLSVVERRRLAEQSVRRAHNRYRSEFVCMKAYSSELDQVASIDIPLAQQGFDKIDLGVLRDYAPLTMGISGVYFQSRFILELKQLPQNLSASDYQSEVRRLVKTVNSNKNSLDGKLSRSIEDIYYDLSRTHAHESNKNFCDQLVARFQKTIDDYHADQSALEFKRGLLLEDSSGQRVDLFVNGEENAQIFASFKMQFVRNTLLAQNLLMLCNQSFLVQSSQFGYQYSVAAAKFMFPASEREMIVKMAGDNTAYFQSNWFAPIFQDVPADNTITVKNVPLERVRNRGTMNVHWRIELETQKDSFSQDFQKCKVTLDRAEQEIYDPQYRQASRNIWLDRLYCAICNDVDPSRNELEALMCILDLFPACDTWPSTEYALWTYLKAIEQYRLPADSDMDVQHNQAKQLLLMVYYDENIARQLLCGTDISDRYLFQISFLEKMLRCPQSQAFFEQLVLRYSHDEILTTALKYCSLAMKDCQRADMSQIQHALNDPKTKKSRQHFILAALRATDDTHLARDVLTNDILRMSLDHETLQHLLIVCGAPISIVQRLEQPDAWQAMVDSQNRNTTAQDRVYNPTGDHCKAYPVMLLWRILIDEGYSQLLDVYPGESYDNNSLQKLRSFLQLLVHNTHHREYLDILKNYFKHEPLELVRSAIQLIGVIKNPETCGEPYLVDSIINKICERDLSVAVALHTLEGTSPLHIRLIFEIMNDKHARAQLDLATLHYFYHIAPTVIQPILSKDKLLQKKYHEWCVRKKESFTHRDRFELLEANPRLWNVFYPKAKNISKLLIWGGLSQDQRLNLPVETLYQLLTASEDVQKHAQIIFADPQLRAKINKIPYTKRAEIVKALELDLDDLREDRYSELLYAFHGEGYRELKQQMVVRWIDKMIRAIHPKSDGDVAQNQDYVDPWSALLSPIFENNSTIPELTYAKADCLSKLFKHKFTELLEIAYQGEDSVIALGMQEFLAQRNQRQLRLTFIHHVLSNRQLLEKLMNSNLNANPAFTTFKSFAQECFADAVTELTRYRSTQILPFSQEQLKNLCLLLTADARRELFTDRYKAELFAGLLIHHDDASFILDSLNQASLETLVAQLDAAQLRLLYVKISHCRLAYLQNQPSDLGRAENIVFSVLNKQFLELKSQVEQLFAKMGVTEARVDIFKDWLALKATNQRTESSAPNQRERLETELKERLDHATQSLTQARRRFEEAKRRGRSNISLASNEQELRHAIVDLQHLMQYAPRIGDSKSVERLQTIIDSRITLEFSHWPIHGVKEQENLDALTPAQLVVAIKAGIQIAEHSPKNSYVFDLRSATLSDELFQILSTYRHLLSQSDIRYFLAYENGRRLNEKYQPNLDDNIMRVKWCKLQADLELLKGGHSPERFCTTLIKLAEHQDGQLFRDLLLGDPEIMSRLLLSEGISDRHLLDLVNCFSDTEGKRKIVESLLGFALTNANLYAKLTSSESEKLLSVLAAVDKVDQGLWFDFIALLPRHSKYAQSNWQGLLNRCIDSQRLCVPLNFQTLRQHFWNSDDKGNYNAVQQFDHWVFKNYVDGNLKLVHTDFLNEQIRRIISAGLFNGNDYVDAVCHNLQRDLPIDLAGMLLGSSNPNDRATRQLQHTVLLRKYNSADVEHVYRLLESAPHEYKDTVLNLIYQQPLLDTLIQRSTTNQLRQLASSSTDESFWNVLAQHFIENREVRGRIEGDNYLLSELYVGSALSVKMVWVSDRLLELVISDRIYKSHYFKKADNDQAIDLIVEIKRRQQLGSSKRGYDSQEFSSMDTLLEDDESHHDENYFANDKLISRLLYGKTSSERVNSLLLMLVEQTVQQVRTINLAQSDDPIHTMLTQFLFSENGKFSGRFVGMLKATDPRNLYSWIMLMNRIFNRHAQFDQPHQLAAAFFAAFTRKAARLNNELTHPEVIDRFLSHVNAQQLFNLLVHDFGPRPIIMGRVILYCCNDPTRNVELTNRLNLLLAQKKIGNRPASVYISKLYSRDPQLFARISNLLNDKQLEEGLQSVFTRNHDLPANSLVLEIMYHTVKDVENYIQFLKLPQNIQLAKELVNTVDFDREYSSDTEPKCYFKQASKDIPIPNGYRRCFLEIYSHLLSYDDDYLTTILGNYSLRIVANLEVSYRFVLKNGGELTFFEQQVLNNAIRQRGESFWNICLKLNAKDLTSQLPAEKIRPSQNPFTLRVLQYLVCNHDHYCFNFFKNNILVSLSEDKKNFVVKSNTGFDLKSTGHEELCQIFEAAQSAKGTENFSRLLEELLPLGQHRLFSEDESDEDNRIHVDQDLGRRASRQEGAQVNTHLNGSEQNLFVKN